jgi:hypothetical protein
MITMRRIGGVLIGLVGIVLVLVACVPFAVCWLLFRAGMQAIEIAKEWTK